MPPPTDTSLRARSFGAVADTYDRLRPAPAPAALDWLLPSPCRRAADVGAGTGLFSRALAARVDEVVAVEPDERMARVLAARSPGVQVLGGQAEALPIDDCSLDAVFVSAAWHWMEPAKAGAEFARVLRPGGRLGVVWTNRDRQVEWVAELDEVRGAREPDGSSPARRRREVELPADLPFSRGVWASFRFTRTMSVEDFVEWQGTYSGLIVAADADREAALDRVRRLLRDRFGEGTTLEVPMLSRCWRADRIG